MFRHRRVVLALLAVLLLAPLAVAQETGEMLTNTTCPVMLGEPVNPDISIVYRGQRVYFCCDSCVEDFTNGPTAYLANLPQFADPAPAAPASAPAPVPAPVSAPAPAPAPAPVEEEDDAIGALHPAAVHFPIALGLAAALAVLLSLVIRGPFFTHVVTFCTVCAGLGGVAAYLLGEPAEELRGRMSESLHERVELHADLGTVAMYALLGAMVLWLISRFAPRVKPLHIVAVLAILAAAGVVGYTGYLGGEVVRPGHLDALLEMLPF